MEEASRKRRKIESDEEINVEGKKLTNKERAKIHRDSKELIMICREEEVLRRARAEGWGMHFYYL